MTAPALAPAARHALGRPRMGGLGSAVRAQSVRVRQGAPLGAVLLTALVAHVGVAPHLGLRGAAPDVPLVAVAAVAAGRGSRAGAAFGFAAGLGADLFLATPLGTSALAYTLVGHLAGRSSRSRRPGAAAALCRPASTCFACRTGRRHGSAPLGEPSPAIGSAGSAVASAGPAVGLTGPAVGGVRPARLRRRAAARRAAIQRGTVLAAVAVGGGRLATAAVATGVGGVPFPGAPGLLRMAAVAAVSAPLGPVALVAVRRLPASGTGGGR